MSIVVVVVDHCWSVALLQFVSSIDFLTVVLLVAVLVVDDDVVVHCDQVLFQW